MSFRRAFETVKAIEKSVLNEINSMLLAYGRCEHSDCEICAARDPFIRRLTKLRQRLMRKARRK